MNDDKVVIFPMRGQPLHNCHEKTIKETLRSKQVVVVIGSIQECYELHDPFTYPERIEMASETLFEAGVIRIAGVPDFHNGPKWTAAILKAAGLKASEAVVYSRNDWTLMVCREAKIGAEIQPPIRGLNGTAVRNRIGQGREWKTHVPKKVAVWLTNGALRVDADPSRPGIEELDGLSGEERIKYLYQKETKK